MNCLEAYDNTSRAKLASTKALDVKKYFHTHGYLAGLALPEYYQANCFDKIQLDSFGAVGSTKKFKPNSTHPITIYSPKGVGWRKFSLIHPYAFWHLVDQICIDDHWQVLQRILCKETRVSVYSYPCFDVISTPTGDSINAWCQFSEVDILRCSNNFDFLVKCDIQSCYDSIYTHSIAWAIESKTVAKNNYGPGLLGNRLDKLFQYCQDKQSNGIPTGNRVSDFIVEIILKRIDELLTDALEKHCRSEDYIVGRYRDDYRFLCNSKTLAERFPKILNRILHENFDLSLNHEKTSVHDNIVMATRRAWQFEFQNSAAIQRLLSSYKIEFHDIKEYLISLYDLQFRHGSSRIAITGLTKLIKEIKTANLSFGYTSRECVNIDYLVSLLRHFVRLKEDATPFAFELIDILISERPDLFTTIIESWRKISANDNDCEYQEAWLLRLCLHHCPKETNKWFSRSKYDLIKMVVQRSQRHCRFFKPPSVYMDHIGSLNAFSLIDRSKLDSVKGKPIKNENIFVYSAS